MAYQVTEKRIEDKGGDAIVVFWTKKDNARLLSPKHGRITHNVTDDMTRGTIKTATDTKVENDEGMIV